MTYIPKSGDDCVFDPMNSHLRFKLKLTNGTGAMSITPEGGIDSISQRLDFTMEVMFLN